MTMLNCGYCEPGKARASGDGEAESFELYRRLLDPVTARGVDFLEVGSCRGGGTAFVHRELGARRTVGLDFAWAAVNWCRRKYNDVGLEFHVGDAAKPPFPNESFDMVFAVEVTHCLPDKSGFLDEMARVLKPGGCLQLADFFYCRPDSSHAIGTFETAVAASSFELAATDDWTSAAIASIEVDTERRERFFRKSIPHFLWSIALDFASTTRSSTYYALRGERAVYRSFSLRKPHGSKMPTT